MGLPPSPYLCGCFPMVSLTSMPFSICFTSFPGPLMPADPGRNKRKGELSFQEPDAKTKDIFENLSLWGGDER